MQAGLLLQKRKKELAILMSREMGKILQETLGDVQEAIDMAFYVAGEGRRLFGETTPSELRDKFAMSLRLPVGVCKGQKRYIAGVGERRYRSLHRISGILSLAAGSRRRAPVPMPGGQRPGL